MATQNSLQDCYFYFYSSCSKGDECPFRHCELALGTETVCSLWREGRCFRNNCKFRHMESRINRSMIPCYWENQPSGCRKPHCVFLHRKLRNGTQVITDNQGLILPTNDGKISPKLPDLNKLSNVPAEMSLTEKVVESDVVPDPSLAPVPPLVLSFDEGEESDAESVTSTPVKQCDKKTALTVNPSVKALGALEEKNFGIKTLEQIRMEKIHKESDSYYGAAYTSTPIDASRLIDQHYPPKTEYIVLPKDSSLDKTSPSSLIEPKLSGVNEETDLRGRLSNRRNTPSNKVNQVKRLINFKKQNANQVDEDSKKLDFKIKTLEEIRREKENKQNFSTVNQAETAANELISKSINMKPAETLEKPNEVSVMNETLSELSGKRKIDVDSCSTASKIIRLVNSSNDNGELVNQTNTCSETDSENQLQPNIYSSFESNEDRNRLYSHALSLSSLKQCKTMIPESCIPDTEMNGGVTALSSSTSLPRPNIDRKLEHDSAENQHILSDEINDKTLNSSPLPTAIKSNLNFDNGENKKNNIIDRSMSVDDDFDELLGDDMNMDEIDAAPNDDILLEIEEFLDS